MLIRIIGDNDADRQLLGGKHCYCCYHYSSCCCCWGCFCYDNNNNNNNNDNNNDNNNNDYNNNNNNITNITNYLQAFQLIVLARYPLFIVIVVTINITHVQGCGLVPFPPNLCHLPLHDRHRQPGDPAECAQDGVV